MVTKATPAGPVIVSPTTSVTGEGGAERQREAVTYEDIGGLTRQVRRVREMIELPLMHTRRCSLHLGIEAPKGVLLYGPPGTGKTLIARAVAHEVGVQFFHVNGPEIIDKLYGQSEAHLRNMFEEAEAAAPAIIFIDEIDAIAPKREEMSGERQVERRVVAQLLALMDGLKSRGQVIVIAATNMPDALDPALRRPGRFDREIEIGVPDTEGRREILEIHSRGMPLAEEVGLTGHGAASPTAIRRRGSGGAVPGGGDERAAAAAARTSTSARTSIPHEKLEALKVERADFEDCAHRSRALGLARGLGRGAGRAAGTTSAAWTRSRRCCPRRCSGRSSTGSCSPRLACAPSSGICSMARPGTGKTLLAKAVAGETRGQFHRDQGAAARQHVGRANRSARVREVFRKARQAAPAIIFFDEIDALAPRARRRGIEPGQRARRGAIPDRA